MGRDSFLYNEISQTISALPLPRPEWPHSFGCTKKSKGTEKPRLHPFPIVYLTSNGSKRAHFKIEPTGTTLLQHAKQASSNCLLDSTPPVPTRVGKKPVYHQFEVQGRTKFLATVKGVEGAFGHHKYACKHVRASKIEAHVFDSDDRHHLEETVQQSWPRILQDGLRSHMSGDCVLFGVVTKAYTGRLETIGITSTELAAGVHVVDNGLACSGSKANYERKDSGEDANKVIGVDLECYMLMRNYHCDHDDDDAASPPWLLSKPISVSSWDNPMFQYAVAFCQNRDSWWGNDRREEFLDEMQIFPQFHNALEKEAKLTRSSRRNRRRKRRNSLGSETGSVASWSTAGTGSRVSCVSGSYPMPSLVAVDESWSRLPNQIKIRFDPSIDEDAELSDPD